MFDTRKIHLIPPAVIDRAEQMLADVTRQETREIHASSLEAVRDYCIAALKKYETVKDTFNRRRR